jgi:hypothetical protein
VVGPDASTHIRSDRLCVAQIAKLGNPDVDHSINRGDVTNLESIPAER